MLPAAAGSAAKKLELAVDSATAMPGHNVVLTATSGASVSGTGNAIEIFDKSTGALVAQCATGNQCVVAYAAHSGTHSFAAFVTRPTSKVPAGSVTASNTVNASWIGVSLVADHAAVAPGKPITITATSSVNLDKTGWQLGVYDIFSRQRVTYCTTGNTCRSTLTQASGSTLSMVAVLAPPAASAPPANLVVAQTDVFTVSWLGVATYAVADSAQPGSTVHVSATVNTDLTNSGWALGILNDHGQMVGAPCTTGNVCRADVAVTGAMPSFRGVVGVLPADSESMLSRLMRKVAPPSKIVNVQAQSDLVQPSVRPHLLWGVDSCKSFTSDAGANSGLYPQVASTLGAPDFWGRYLTNTVCPGISGTEIAAAHNRHMGILPIYNDYNCSAVSGYATGRQYAAEAVKAAWNDIIPTGTAIAIDIEPPGSACPGAGNVDGGFIEGWYDGIVGAHFVPAYYGNGSPGSAFANAWCAAVTDRPAVATNSHIWTFQPSLWGGYTKGSFPSWGLAYNTHCPEHGTAWQYMLSAGSTPDVDHDLLLSEFPLWYP